MSTFLSVVGFFLFIGSLIYGVVSLITKNHRAKKSLVLAMIGVVLFMIGGSLAPEEPAHSNTEKTVKKESKNDHTKKSKATAQKSSKTKSSESKVSKSNSESSDSISDSDSKKALKQAVSYPMEKQSYLNLESGLLKAAKVDDVNSPADNISYQLTRFHSRAKNIESLEKKANDNLSSEKDEMNSNDFTTYKQYIKNLKDYLSALHDYAITYQADVPSENNPDTDSDTIIELKQEVSQSQQKFESAKNAWSNSYDSIVNEQ